jgi:4-diphosphocytidyl-2-C-methyl-D-erythritol kinase
MFEIARIKARAKLNLHLEIGPKRPDGYHELVSLFQTVSLADELRFRRRGKNGIELIGNFPFPAEENIIAKACALFMEVTGLESGIEVSVEKNIPMGGGLGGGSSDAAAALRALNALFGEPLALEELSLLGASLGSDVPFFAQAACAVVEGRGERVGAFPGRSDLHAVIVDPGFPVSTKEAYLLWDRQAPSGGGFAFDPSRIRAEYAKAADEWGFFNSFFPLIARENPVLVDIRDELREDGALRADMSGSGSSMYGIFDSAVMAEKAEERQRTSGRKARTGFLLARMDDIILQ